MAGPVKKLVEETGKMIERSSGEKLEQVTDDEVIVEKKEGMPSSVADAAGEEVAHFVLIHGIGGGGWCWYKIRWLMESSGYKVSCLDLKASGIHPSHSDNILTFQDYNQPLSDFLSNLPHNQKVILVGHSAGGLSVTDATHKFASKISLAIYIGATMLKTGYQSEQDIKQGVPDLSEFGDDVYDLGFGLGLNHPPTSALVKKHLQRKIIYHLSPPEDSTLASMLLRPGPLKALLSARFDHDHRGGDDVDKVPRVYIKTLYDRVVKLEQQEAMIERWPPSQVYSLESDHSPFFSTPSLLFALLVKAAASATAISF